MKKRMTNFWIILSLIIVFGASYFIFVSLPARDLERNYRYTIVTVLKFESQSEGSEEAEFDYRIKNRTYRGSFPITWGYEGKFKVGSRLFIKFSPENPENAQIEYDLTVPETLKAPENGWKEIPR